MLHYKFKSCTDAFTRKQISNVAGEGGAHFYNFIDTVGLGIYYYYYYLVFDFIQIFIVFSGGK